MSAKLELLKFSKSQLIQKCKQYNVHSNGSKSDMIDRLLNNKVFINDMESIIKNKEIRTKPQHSFYVFNPPKFNYLSKRIEKCEGVNDLFGIDFVLHTFMSYLPIYTMSNFICAFHNIQIIIKHLVSLEKSSRTK